MICAGNQPYFIPYIGYWQLINSADVFEISDDYAYINKGWVSKNRILVNGMATDYRIEVSHASSLRLINELMLCDFSVQKKLKTLEYSYSKAPYFDDGFKVMQDIFSYDDRNLADFLTNSIYRVCDYLDINTNIVKSSSFEGNSKLKREYRIYDMCERLGADTYYNAIGGQALYSYEDFRKHGIKLGFIKTGDIKYKQFKNEFVPNLSIIDVIMFNPKEEIKKMLDNYTILEENNNEYKNL